MSTSKIFLNNLSVVDHAYVDDKGQIVGGSFNPSFIVSGKIDPVEKVVVDFSTVKKSMKTLIDQHIWDPHNNGYDHKIWWINGFSKGIIEPHDHADRYIIKTDYFTSEFPSDALKIIDVIKDAHPSHSASYIGRSFEKFLETELSKVYPNVDVSVECSNNIDVHTYDKSLPVYYFRYVHGLKDSTSYGCQNVCHGHLSYFQYHYDDDLCLDIQKDLDNAIFINKSNIVSEDDEFLTISYITEQRGLFKATYNKKLCKLIVLDTETTIELIAEYINKQYNITDFFVSEGLSKGCYM